MRPWQTILLLLAALVIFVYLRGDDESVSADSDRFVDCYVDLMLMHHCADSSDGVYSLQRDSIFSVHGFDSSSFVEFKEELNLNPDQAVSIWQEIEAKLKIIKQEHEVIE